VTDHNGNYQITPVHPGVYSVLFRECGFFGEDQHRYQAQWWDGQPDPQAAKLVYALGNVTDIDAHVVSYSN
jgi:hypothetical protein